MANEKNERCYTVDCDYENESWPGKIMLDGVVIAQFVDPSVAVEVSSMLNNKYFPSRLQRIGRAFSSGGLSLLTESRQPDMPEGA